MFRRAPLSLAYADQVPLLARLLEQGGPIEAEEPRRLVSAAIHHNVAGYVMRALRAEDLRLPVREVQRLTDFSSAAVLQASLLRRELGTIADPLERACAAPPLVIKGPALADRFYPDRSLRPYADLDLLVPVHRLELACRCLEELGYERLEEFRPGYAERYGHDVHLRRRLGRRWWVDVELHWRVGDDPAGAVLTHEALVEGARELEVDGTRIAVPAPAAQMTLLAVHLLSDRSKRLAWIHDLVLVGRSLGQAEWEEVFADADAWGLLWPLGRSLDYADRHLGWRRRRPLPPAAALPWGPMRAVEELDVRAAPHLGRLAALSWRERMAFLRAVLVPSAEGLRGTVGQGREATTWQLVRRHVRRVRMGLRGPPRGDVSRRR